MTNTTQTAELLGLVNHVSENVALSAMRNDTVSGIEVAEALEPSDFFDPRRALAFEAMRSLLHGIDAVTTDNILAEARRLSAGRKGVPVLSVDFVESLTADYQRIAPHVNTVKRLAWLRGAGQFADWLVNALQARTEPNDLFVQAQENWQALMPMTVGSGWVYGWDTVTTHNDILKQRIQDNRDGTTSRFDWPWQSWQRMIRPLRPGMVGMFAAPDGMGKSTFLEMVAEWWAAEGHQVVMVHLEDALDYKLDRRLARHAQIPIDCIEDGTMGTGQKQLAHGAQGRISEWGGRLHYFHAPGKSMSDIIRELETRKAEGVCDAVVFDYLDKVQPTREQAKLFGGNTWEIQGHNMEQLKSFAERNSLPVFTATQGNKAMQTTGTQTRQAIQGSGQKSQKSQLVVILTRDIVGDQGLTDVQGRLIAEPGEYSPIAKLRIDKQNRGRTGQFEQVFVGKHFSVRDIQR